LEENFDRFNFAIYKEKEMADFRRWFTAFAVLALFVGLASAQVPGGGGTGTFSCTANAEVPPALRAEGMTEQAGDIVLRCTGGTPLPAGTAIPTANITVSLNTNVTSRIISSSGTTGLSEALLLIDEPGLANATPVVPGFGPAAPQIICGGNSFLNFPQGAGPGGCVVFSNIINGIPVEVATAGGSTPGANMFLGTVSGNQVTFNGIPILAPVSSGVERVFRITNIRANVSGLGGGGLPGTTPLLASISISGSTSVPVSNPVLTAGFVQAGLTVGFRNAANSSNLGSGGTGFNQCGPGNTGGNPLPVGVLTYTENFGTSFKTRVAVTPTNSNPQSGTVAQNIPGAIYNSESGFVVPFLTFTNTGGISTNVSVVGLADYGTRLKAVFNSIPTGMRIFVSTTNLASNTTSATTPANAATFAPLVPSETSPEGATLAPTTSVNGNTTALTEIPVVNGSATAVWEVYNTQPALVETLNFGVWTQFTANPAGNSPPPGTGTVNLSYAPTPPIPFSATAGATASGVLPIPRFADTSTARNILSLGICQTLLLYPFVTNQSGFDTGIAIANTSTDPVGTGAQAGTCTMNFYGDTAPKPVAVASIATGTVYTTLASISAPGFQGYMMALCNFQYAHGFAFISDLGARNLAMGYLALVVNNGAFSRSNAPSAETLGH
jgi:hypothetical protein